MTDIDIPEQSPEATGGVLMPIPAMPVARSVQRGSPYMIVSNGQRHTIGWQDVRKHGPSFVVVRLSATGTRIIDRFPLTDDGWSAAWHALARIDGDAADAVAAALAAARAAKRARSEIHQLDADSACCMPGVVFLGGYLAGAELAAGQTYDLRFLADRLAVFPCRRVDVLVDIPYGDVELIDIGGPGLVKKWSPRQQAGITWLLGLPGAVLATSQTKIQTVVRIHAADCELFFLNTEIQADGLRIALSGPLRDIREAQSLRTAGSEPPAPRITEPVTDQLSRLASMLDTGLLTRDEFDQLKAKLIAEL